MSTSAHDRRMRRKAVNDALFGVLPVLVTVSVLAQVFGHGLSAVDFRQEYWAAGWRLLHGANPYLWTRAQVTAGEAFVYPAPTALLFVPFALLPAVVSGALFTALCIGAGLATLRVLEVRDWRLYGLVAVTAPVVAGWQTANLTLFLALGIALVWRMRDRPLRAGVVAAVAIALKPFVWPIALWLLATRRFRAAAACAGTWLVVNLLAWAVVGFGEISQYLHLVARVTDALYREGYGLVAIAMHLGSSHPAATVVEVGLSAGFAVGVLLAAHRGQEMTALAVSIGLMLAASPLVWNHYLALLIVPLAIARPRLSWAWALPLVLWVCPSDGVTGWEAGVGLAITVACLFVAGRASRTAATCTRTPPPFEGVPAMSPAGRTTQSTPGISR